ncbi:MAG: FKBP-type peptidyl-prolyl cis-trans isomerase, partial [Bacteroidales bacterium]
MNNPKVFTLTYELRSGDAKGQVIEAAGKEQPAEFLFGMGNLVKEFEDNIQNLDKGEKFDFVIKADNAYGQPDEKAIVELPKSIFVVDGKLAEDLLEVGKVVPMKDQQGNPLYGTILEIGEDKVKMDFNHPLAGHD